jgi:hypothetical protein
MVLLLRSRRLLSVCDTIQDRVAVGSGELEVSDRVGPFTSSTAEGRMLTTVDADGPANGQIAPRAPCGEIGIAARRAR